MDIEDHAFEDARHTLQHDGGVVTVILGNHAEAPTDWTWHPRVHWVVASRRSHSHHDSGG